MSSISSWMRQARLSRVAFVWLTQVTLATVTHADTNGVRLAKHFRDPAGYPMTDFGSLADIQKRQDLAVQLFLANAGNCRDLLALPLGKERGYDKTQNAYMIIKSIAVECWAVSQVDPAAPVAVTGPDDRITPAMIHGIMADAERRSAEDEDWAKTLMTFPGGDIVCRDEERCRLSLPDGRDPPEQSLAFELMMANGEERFVKIAILVYGRAIFYYGVRWRGNEAGGEVVGIFPDLD